MNIARRTYNRIKDRLPSWPRNVGELHIWRDNYLWTSGWLRSRREKMAVAADGTPIPWYTYPAIKFLDGRIPRDATIFEYGMGNSTLWWSERVAVIITCEGDQSWYGRIAAKMPPNVKALVYPHESDDYVKAAAHAGHEYDVIILDGRRRVECCRHGMKQLSQQGIVIWDNADRDRYIEGYNLLEENGFKRLDFWGMSPLVIHESCTSIFYRSGNVLGI